MTNELYNENYDDLNVDDVDIREKQDMYNNYLRENGFLDNKFNLLGVEIDINELMDFGIKIK